MTKPVDALAIARPPATLDCAHCGCPAIESATGWFADGDGDACMTCGMPGHVSIDEDDHDSPGGAYWYVADDHGTCTDPECLECEGYREDNGLPSLRVTDGSDGGQRT